MRRDFVIFISLKHKIGNAFLMNMKHINQETV